jgi:hypothetical protein
MEAIQRSHRQVDFTQGSRSGDPITIRPFFFMPTKQMIVSKTVWRVFAVYLEPVEMEGRND